MESINIIVEKEVNDITSKMHENRIPISLKEKYFVYSLYKGSDLVYVGKTTNIHFRVYSHLRDKEFDSYSYIECKSRDEMEGLEALLVIYHDPKYNKEIPLEGTCSIRDLRKLIVERNNHLKYNNKYYFRNLLNDLKKLKLPIIEFKNSGYIPNIYIDYLCSIADYDVNGEGLYRTWRDK